MLPDSTGGMEFIVRLLLSAGGGEVMGVVENVTYKNWRWFIFFLFYSAALPQSRWQHSAYQTTTHRNFRSNKLFQQTITFNQIDYPLLHAAIFFVTNETRVKNKRPPLSFALALERAAYHHSKRMVEQNFFSHENPFDKARQTSQQRAELAGIKNPMIGENIATHFGIQYKANAPIYPVDPLKGTFSYEHGGPLIPAHTYLSFAEAVTFVVAPLGAVISIMHRLLKEQLQNFI